MTDTATLTEAATAARQRNAKFKAEYVCGACGTGQHTSCRRRFTSGLVCHCTADGHGPTKCVECGTPESDGNPLLEGTLVCADANDCRTTIDSKPLMVLLRACQTVRIEAGVEVERPRRATPAERAERQQAKVQAKARLCGCSCGETTGGGLYRPGHDARHVKNLAARVLGGDLAKDDALAALPSEALRAKLGKRLA